MTTTYLALTWTISRAQDTYGYNRVTLRDERGNRHSCVGGGYDMVGTVVGDWLEATYNARLNSLAIDAIGDSKCPDEGSRLEVPGFYGMHRNSEMDRVVLDGAFGLSSMEAIAKAIGLEVKYIRTRKGHTTGFIVTDTKA